VVSACVSSIPDLYVVGDSVISVIVYSCLAAGHAFFPMLKAVREREREREAPGLRQAAWASDCAAACHNFISS
jgi:hypothetical protein